MAFTDSNYKDTDAYCAACLIDLNPAGKDKVQALCKLPVKTQDGDYNTNAMSSAAGVLYAQAKMDVPPALKGMG
jgi:hypothetical protein